MFRQRQTPRSNWRETVESQGLLFHTTPDGPGKWQPYWTEDAAYVLSEREVAELEKATKELHELALVAVQHVLDHDLFDRLKIPFVAARAIERAWNEEPPSVYGRFDLAYDGVRPPKLLEYNADTPTALLEAAIIQWKWLQDVMPERDQFNSIWEGLVEYWRWCKDNDYLKSSLVHFAHAEPMEDFMTTLVLRDTAQEAGLETEGLLMSELGWDTIRREFVDMSSRPIKTLFKLYPWENVIAESFGGFAIESLERTQWIEPIWKMVLSNKGILPILWEIAPNHPNLLPSHFDRSGDLDEYVRKPLLSREGENVMIKRHGSLVRTAGEYGESGYVFQQYVELPDFDGNRPVIGSWVIDGEPRGIGIRESDGLITDNLSRFVPHYIAG